MRSNFKKWRQSASVIVAAKTALSANSSFNYELMTMKRSKKSSTMPKASVFPGGHVDKADSSAEWLKLFENFGFKLASFDNLNPKQNRPAIFNADNIDEVPKHISLRITAIRETFEESGILICRSNQNKCNEPLPWANFVTCHDIQKWQERVHQDPLQFIKLCTQLELYPDLWSLHEWSNWITPPSIHAKFNTIFFLSSFQQVPPTSVDQSEITHIEWATPTEYIEANANKNLTLPIPQFYEVSRLKQFLDINNLLKFASDRACHGLQSCIPHKLCSKSDVCLIFPGDDLYPDAVDLSNEEIDIVDTIPDTNVQHRMYMKSFNQFSIRTKNYTPPCNHIAPLSSKL